MDERITTLKTDIESAWARASDRINKAVQSIDTILKDIEKRAVTNMTQSVDYKFRNLETKWKNLDTRLNALEVLTAGKLIGGGTSKPYKI